MVTPGPSPWAPRRGGILARLSLRLLGPFQIVLDGSPAAGFASDKVRALLAYLCAEGESPHRREKLAGLLWPEWPEQSARTNLRQALANLRQVIGDQRADPSFLRISRQTLQFNADSDAWVDINALARLVESRSHAVPSTTETIERLEEAVGLYRGEFLEGFSLPDSAPFEEWVLLQREHSHRVVIEALQRLIDAYEQRGALEPALHWTWRVLDLDPWREQAHRQAMRLLALTGKRSAALTQYETCRRLLADELGVEPGEATTRLYEQIRDSALGERAAHQAKRPSLPSNRVRTPAFLTSAVLHPSPPPLLVAREDELGRLDGFLDTAVAGAGRVAFVTGEAGSGKTTLIQAFALRAQEQHTDLIVAGGSCNAYTGVGDPYLPFREILEMLTGDVESHWGAGSITSEHARRLWNTLPRAAQALMDAGPDLIGRFVLRHALTERAARHRAARYRAGQFDAIAEASPDNDWLTRLSDLRAPTETDRGLSGPEQGAIFSQYASVLERLSQGAPLLLLIDDLQWADSGSVHLLFHLGRGLARSPILIVGTYRAEEVTAGRGGQRHPLEPVVHELQRLFGDITIDLAAAEGRRFVEALLDSEPNRLADTFRERLHRRTRGHPLFTIELLRGLKERGDLLRDAEGRWTEGTTLDWETLPARVDAVIAERIGRLPEVLQDALRAASVEGEVFTCEVIAQACGLDEGHLARCLSGELDRKHRLVGAQGIVRVEGRRLSRYRFRHILVQTYLYHSLDPVERPRLHEAVGVALEGLYEDLPEAMAAISGQLARHFEQAGRPEKALQYLQQAGERAVRLSAFEESMAHLRRGLSLLRTLPDPADEARGLGRAQQELALQLALGAAAVSCAGYGLEGEQHYARARELSEELGETSQLCLALGRLSTFHYVRSQYDRARELAEEAIGLAEDSGDPLHIALGHYYLGSILLHLGEFADARTHFEEMIAFYDPQQHHDLLVALRGSDAGTTALAFRACCTWCLGYPEQASKQAREVVALARQLDHPWSLAAVLCYAACMISEMSRDAEQLERAAEEITRLAAEKVRGWSGAGALFCGAALALRGQADAAIAQLENAEASFESLGFSYYAPGRLRALAEAQAKAGHVDQGLASLAQALAFVKDTNECQLEAELYRVRGELQLAQGHDEEAELSFDRAIQIARHQSAKSWELRATVSLCRLWRRQGRREEARQRLAAIYGWFTEGLGTPDLMEARALLQDLA